MPPKTRKKTSRSMRHIKSYLRFDEYARMERLRQKETRCSVSRWIAEAVMERVSRLEADEVRVMQERYGKA